MQGFRDVFVAGLRTTLRNWRAMLPLFIVGFALGLVQTWPLLGAAAGGALSNPLIRRLASGGSQSAIDLFLSNPGTISAGAGLWALGTFVFTLLFGAAYNFFAGGILNTYLGISARSFWAACRRTFWSFTGLGLLLVVLAPLLIAVGAALGGWLGWSGALVATLVLLQLANMLASMRAH